ncbi:MAG: hypothetical protein MUF80_04520 [Burkholderiales bacterium]|jgi:hypothetical protein|nr:hypothetical protein [Burkholderiales bacterium]
MNPIGQQISSTARQAFRGRPHRSRPSWTNTDLRAQSDTYRGTGGCSEENGDYGFLPAFRDHDTGVVYRARFLDGNPAPFHVLDGLPDEVVVNRAASGRVLAVKGSLVSGFVRLGRFYTRDEAVAAVSETLPCAA